MAFKLKSGNTTSFKGMGSSPAKEVKVDMNNPKVEGNYKKYKDNPEYRAALDKKAGGKFEYDADKRVSTTSTPAKQKLNKGGEAQDQDKIFDDKGNHIGTYVNGKKIMKSTTSAHGQLDDAKREFDADVLRAKRKTTDPSEKPPKSKKSPAKQARPQPTYEGTDEYRKEKDIPKKEFKDKGVKKKSKASKRGLKDLRSFDKNIDLDKGGNEPVKNSGFGPRVDGSGQKELKKLKPRHPGRKVMKDGPKNKVHGVDSKKDPHWQPHQFRSPAKQVGVGVSGKPATQTNDLSKTKKSMKKAKKANTNAKTTAGKVKSSKDFYGAAF